MGFVRQHAFFSPATATAFLSADLFDAGTLGSQIAFFEGFDFIEQQAATEKAVESLLPGGLALDLQTGRAMEQHHTGGAFVDILATVAAGPDEGLLDVRFAHAESHHALSKLVFLIRRDGKRTHGDNLMAPRRKAKLRKSFKHQAAEKLQAPNSRTEYQDFSDLEVGAWRFIPAALGWTGEIAVRGGHCGPTGPARG